MKVFVVTEGDYSDYSIYAVCSTKEKADQVCDLMKQEDKYKDPEIEEWELDEVPSRIEKGLALFTARWVDDLQEFKIWKTSPICQCSLLEKRETIIPGKYVYFCSIEARDEEHARKIALEKFIQFKAEGK